MYVCMYVCNRACICIDRCIGEYVPKWVPKLELIFNVCKPNRVKAQTAVNLQLHM